MDLMHSRPSQSFSIVFLVLLLSSAVTVAFGAQVAFAQTFSITISSPNSGAVFNRGQTVTITASVSSGGPVSGASVTANSPTGGTITLSETATLGTYSAQYTILATDPVGTWTINVQAIKNGQVASTQTSVSISGSLKVSIVSPAANAKFNIGETVTVKATVTLQDSSPVPASASVGFSKPIAGSVSASVDASDSSGRTWTGRYTILPSDVPADGFTWPITMAAGFAGNTGSSVQNVNLFRTLKVDVSTFSSSAFNVPKDSFVRGETVFVKGVIDLQDGAVVSSGTVTFVISGTNVATTPLVMTFTPSVNAWTGSYTLSASDQVGQQSVTVSSADAQGNAGSGTHQITVGTTQGLSVSITSPSPNSVFNRGETVTVSATVTMGGAPVTGAIVTANTPTGRTITLTGGAGGIYSAQYTILSTDPVGAWTIAVTATQGAQSSSAQVVAAISASLKVSVITPPAGTKLNIGQTATVKARVTFQDGSAIPTTASVSFNRPTSGTVLMSVDTSDPSGKSWMGSYTIVASDVPTDGATWSIVVSARVGGNTGSSGPTNVNLFNSLKVAVSTRSSSSFTVHKDAFVRGDTVFVEAQITRQDGTIVSSGSVSSKITGTSIANSPVTMAFSTSLNAWVGSYTLLQTDQTGNQIVTVSATDASGNSGSRTHIIGIEVPVTAPQPLEAKITFDPQTQDITVKAVCNPGCISPATVGVTSTASHNNGKGDDKGNNGAGILRTYTIADSAGHTLLLQLSVKSEGHELKARLLSIQYGNSTPITPSDNEVAFEFSQSKHGMKNVEQSINVNHAVNAQAHFNGKKDITKIHIETHSEDDHNDHRPNLTMSGLWLLELVTSNGSLNVVFFQVQ